MKTKIILFLLLFFSFAGSSVFSQTLYLLKYTYPNEQEPTEVLMYRNEDGTGFLRERQYAPDSKEYGVIDWTMDEYAGVDENNKIDENRVIYEGTDPGIIMGDTGVIAEDKLVFGFILDKNSGYFIPEYAYTSTQTGQNSEDAVELKFDLATVLNQEDLTPDFVAKFFDTNEEIYQNLTQDAAVLRPILPKEMQTKLFLLMVANTEDEEIGATCVKDKDRIVKTFSDLTEFLKIKFIPREIFGKEYSKQNVENAIQALNPAPNDIVVFYYSGHGFSYIEKASERFPNIALTSKSFESAETNSLNMENVYNMIVKKGARLNLVLSDCCNSDINGRNTIVGDFASTRPSQIPWDLDNCRALFLQTRASILGTAATKGEYSAGTANLGGIFTYNFRTAMVDFLSKFNKYKPSWQQILKKAELSTVDKAQKTTCVNPNGTSNKCNQHPVFVADIK